MRANSRCVPLPAVVVRWEQELNFRLDRTQTELEGLKRTLVASRRATALQFLCMRKVSTRAAVVEGEKEKK